MTACCHAPLVLRNRCAGCGHRQSAGGIAPIETRYFPPAIWLDEIRQRRQARKAGRTA